MYDQLYEYIENFLNQLLCIFRKATSHFQTFKKMARRTWLRGVYWYSFNGLAKSLWLLRHDLFIIKLEAYVLDNGNLNLLLDYLSFKKQWTKGGSAHSKWSKVTCGIPKGLISGSILFNIFINDIFMIIEQSDICNFADDNTLYSSGQRLTEITENLILTESILNWFRLNPLKAKLRKFQFMTLGDKPHHKWWCFTAKNYNWQKINL